MQKIKYPSSAIRRCDKALKDLMQKVIDTKKGGTTSEGVRGPARTLNRNSGELRNSMYEAHDILGDPINLATFPDNLFNSQKILETLQ